jgi:hypothetical protein
MIVIPSRKRDTSRIVRYIERTNASDIQSINTSLLAERPTTFGKKHTKQGVGSARHVSRISQQRIQSMCSLDTVAPRCKDRVCHPCELSPICLRHRPAHDHRIEIWSEIVRPSASMHILLLVSAKLNFTHTCASMERPSSAIVRNALAEIFKVLYK